MGITVTIYLLGFIVIVILVSKKWFDKTQKILDYARGKYAKKYGELPRRVTTLPGFDATVPGSSLRNWKVLLKEHPEDDKIQSINRISIKYGFLIFGLYVVYTILFVVVMIFVS